MSSLRQATRVTGAACDAFTDDTTAIQTAIDDARHCVRFEVHGLKLVPEVNAREHWSARQKRAKRQHLIIGIIGSAALRRGSSLAPPYLVTITRVSPGTLDDDNNVGACKHVRDAVAKLLDVDDGDNSAVRFVCEQRRGKRGEYGVDVEIEGA